MRSLSEQKLPREAAQLMLCRAGFGWRDAMCLQRDFLQFPENVSEADAEITPFVDVGAQFGGGPAGCPNAVQRIALPDPRHVERQSRKGVR